MKEIKFNKKANKPSWELDNEIKQSRKEQRALRDRRRNKRKEWE